MRYLFVVICIWCSQQARGQEIPLGTWRTHACYQQAAQVAVGKEGTFCRTANGLFLLENDGQTLQILTKQQGLSRAVPTQISYDTQRNALLISYADRTLDLLQNNQLTEIPILRQAAFPNTTQINQIVPTANFTYIAADFGVALLDINKREVRDTYRNLGTNGSELAVYGLTFSQDSLVLATAQGVMIGGLTSNLADFQQWKRFGTIHNLPAQKIKKIVTRQNNVYALTESNRLFRYNHLNQWTLITLPTEAYTDLHAVQEDLYLTAAGKVYKIDISQNVTVLTHTLLQKLQNIRRDASGTLWVADGLNGLLSFQNNVWKNYYPNSPAYPDNWKIKYHHDKIIVTSGGHADNLQFLQKRNGYYSFDAGVWTSIPLPTLTDVTAYAYISKDKIAYIGSYGGGLWQQNADGSLQAVAGFENARITDIAVEENGTVWVANHAPVIGQPSLRKKLANGSWFSFPAPTAAAGYPSDIVIAANGWKWIRLSNELGGGIWVIDEQNNRSRVLNNLPNQGNLPSNVITALAEDKEGLMWVGTAKGIAVFYTPQDVFGNVNALTPIFEGRPVLRAETVNALVVDAGNRKWAGTDTGLWLLGAEGTSLIHYFQENNSPLPTNEVKGLALHPQTGELFAITTAGLISYRGTATEATDEYADVKVFPNPVYPNFDGLVGISGLPAGARVKITDMSNKLFYETEAQGGTASWNLQDYTGARAKAGIYLIYTFKPDGSKAKVLKIAITE